VIFACTIGKMIVVAATGSGGVTRKEITLFNHLCALHSHRVGNAGKIKSPGHSAETFAKDAQDV